MGRIASHTYLPTVLIENNAWKSKSSRSKIQEEIENIATVLVKYGIAHLTSSYIKDGSFGIDATECGSRYS
jgi:hypothetical protein